MSRTVPSLRLAVGSAIALLVVGAASVDSAPALHFELRSSAPEADAVLDSSPDRIQLWFSQDPQKEGARIRLVDGSGDLVELGATEAVPDTASSLRAEVMSPLTDGSYTIHWRAMARDGHVQNGEIPFEVRADNDPAR